eukprot:CAMPEP_0202476776 /NCGR_PEP_ID=MMETSP1360-20130828/93594_1 /ASSEMBLY_ACC=CAM_ASM_000848 /TAXON_ID=515479 /ORGANISM="Licmophora paradoxa, Strain CCMP2313" /LENGTH=637 /DNA_ID=CAMNT_0049103991 /DNA_START=32 /DNA_END=1945 /DNA_ORIENTATION=-
MTETTASGGETTNVVPVDEEAPGETAIVDDNNDDAEEEEEGDEKCNVLKFTDINFEVGKGDKKRLILKNVNGSLKWGRVLAVLGPSGAGKTTLISALTLDAFYGKPTGSVTLNGVPLTDKIFKRQCYVVKQQDKHWPYLTASETLKYAAELYNVGGSDLNGTVNDILGKMGLETCADTRCARLSGGQKRRLSIALALLKSPTLLFLDEPTSGLDSAAASNIMQEILRVAREEKLIILCTIHQPSTKVYNGFDQVMILSKGREAFAGNVREAGQYFASIGHAVPPATNPAEHYLDLVNSDFSSTEEVEGILDEWESKRSGLNTSMHSTKHKKEVAKKQTSDTFVERPRSFAKEIAVMFRRHSLLIIRDPILYLGRCVIFLVTSMVFAFVYWNARDDVQAQASNKMWISIWFIGVPSNMGVVAVYALNDEFKSILRETKNGMVGAVSYVLAKTVLVPPIMFLFAIFALGIPGYAIQSWPIETFGTVICLYAAVIYVFECSSEAFAVLFDDPIIGMLQFMNLWFATFLFAGFLIAVDDLYWPFKLFHYVLPFGYYVRSLMYTLFTEIEWDSCTDPTTSAVCAASGEGIDVLEGLGRVFPVIEVDNYVAQDIGTLLAIAFFFKIVSIVAIIYKTRKVASIQ